MEATLDDKQLLIREMNHRIKNNLSLVGAILSLQARRIPDPIVRDELGRAVTRINNLALVHDRLQMFTSSVVRIEAAPHFQELCEMLQSLLPAGVSLTSKCSGTIDGDSVESLTLIANELVTNAAKYAFVARDAEKSFWVIARKVPGGVYGSRIMAADCRPITMLLPLVRSDTSCFSLLRRA